MIDVLPVGITFAVDNGVKINGITAPYGSYVLSINRPGYLTRYMPVVVSETDPDIIQLAPPDGLIFELWPGDSHMDWIVDVSEIIVIFGCEGARWDDPAYLAQADLNGDGVID